MEFIERPLPKPTDESYMEARLLEALVESRLALEFLSKGLVRNAAGKAFQAWRALMAALLRLELDKLRAMVKADEERRWLESTVVPRVPTTRMMQLSLMLSDIGYTGISAWTDRALNLHDYQYNGPDPDLALSKFRSREEAARATMEFIAEIVKQVESLRGRTRWSEQLEKELEELKRSMKT